MASTAGWAAGLIGTVPLFGHRDLRSPSSGRIFTNCRRMIESHIDIFAPHWVFAEQPYAGKNAYTVARLYGLRAVLEMVCDERDVPLSWVQIKQVSEFFVGTGGLKRDAKKTATIRAAQARGLQVTTDDEADAIALFFYGEARLAPKLQRAAGELFARAS